jgi:hypothetical protein
MNDPMDEGGAGHRGERVDMKVMGRLYEELQEITKLLKENSHDRELSEKEAARITAEVKLRETLAISARRQIVPAPPEFRKVQRLIESRRAIGFQRSDPEGQKFKGGGKPRHGRGSSTSQVETV